MSRYVLEDEVKGRYVLEDAPAAIKAGATLNDIPRQVGLTARYGLEGLANAAQLVTEPLRYLTDKVVPDRTDGVPKSTPLGAQATKLADWLGLPSPIGANERVVGDATRLLAGAGGFGAAGRAASAAPGVVGQVGGALSSNLPQQFASAVGAGLAGGASREAGGGSGMQALSALAGGVVGGLAPGAVGSAVSTVRNMIPKSQQQVDQQISVLLQRADVDWNALPNAARSALREDLAAALRTGQEIDPAAVRRLADFRAVGATPTRGMVSQNPVQITREMNLAKMGANSSDEGLQGLALVQNRNNETLIRNINQAGAAQGDPFRAGQAAVGSILNRDESLRRQVSGLYETARNMPGGDIPLDRTALVNGVYDALARQNKMAYLPDDIANTLNTISQGQVTRGGQTFPVPFDAKALDNLLTDIATAQRSTTDGNVKAALSVARDAINRMPINPVKNTFGGSQVVTDAGAQFLRNQDAQAGQFMGALNQAREAARQRFAWQESARPVEAALAGAQPDRFIKQFVIGGTLDDAQAVAQNAPIGEVKNAILAHLKDKALNGASDEVGKFSQSAFNKALKEIGERKLSLFFSPEEIAQLNAVGRVASYAQVQPVGSAVNNSNSGALLLGKGYDALMSLANRLPVIGPNLVPPIRNIEIAIRNQQAQNIAPVLLAPTQKPPLAQGLLLPAAATGGLLAAP